MSWSITDIIGIGLRLFNNRAEVERLARKSMELFGEWRALIMNVAPQMLEQMSTIRAIESDIGSKFIDDKGAVHQYDVKWVQMALNHLLHPRTALTVDGDMGELTRAAIKEYQELRGLDPDGWLGPLTMAQLDADIRKAHAV